MQHMPVVLATKDAQLEGWLNPRFFRPPGQHSQDPILKVKKKKRKMNENHKMTISYFSLINCWVL